MSLGMPFGIVPHDLGKFLSRIAATAASVHQTGACLRGLPSSYLRLPDYWSTVKDEHLHFDWKRKTSMTTYYWQPFNQTKAFDANTITVTFTPRIVSQVF